MERALQGRADPEALAHAEGCDACRVRVEEIRANVEFMRGVARSLGERGASAGSSGEPGAGGEAEAVPMGYRMVRVIARGGQGVVYEGVQESTKRRVAIKVLEGSAAGGTGGETSRARRRIEREAEITAGLRHPNLVTVYQGEALANGRYALVMELVEGVEIDAWARGVDAAAAAGVAGGIGAGAEARAVLRSKVRALVAVCDGVHHAHLNGVIHRDLKPANVLMTREGVPRVVDFGIARRPGLDERVTRAGGFAGTLASASPEQVSGDPDAVDARSDVYALGLIVFEVLTGRRPYDTEGSLSGAISAITREPPRAMGTVEPGGQRAGAELEAIVRRALAKRREERYQSAEALKRDLENWLEGRIVEARSASAWYQLRKTASRHRVPAAIAAGFFALVSALAVTAAWSSRALAARGAELADALAASTVQRGRLMGMSGENARAEELLWPEFLRAEGDVQSPGLLRDSSPAVMRAGWALCELMSRHASALYLRTGLMGESVQFEANGNRVRVMSGDGAEEVRRVADGALLAARGPRLKHPRKFVGFASSGRWATISDATGSLLVDVQTGAERELTVDEIQGRLVDATASRLLVNDDASRVSLWSRQPLRKISVLAGPTPGAGNFAFTADESAVIGSLDDTIKLWRADDGGEAGAWRVPPEVWSAAVRPGVTVAVRRPGADDVAAAMLSQVLLFGGASSGGAARAISAHRGLIGGLAYSLDGSVLLTWANERNYRLWDARSGELRWSFENGAPVRARAGVSPDGSLVAWCDVHPGLRVVETRNQGWRRVLGSAGNSVQTVRIRPDGTQAFAAASDGTIRAWAVSSGTPLWTVAPGADGLRDRPAAAQTALCLTRGGEEVLVGSEDGVVSRLDARSGARLGSVSVNGPANLLYASPDGTKAALTCRDGTVRVIDAVTLTPIAELAAHQGRAIEAVFSPDGTRLASVGGDGVLAVWSMPSGRLERRIPVAGVALRAVAFAPDGRSLAVGSDDWKIRLFDAATGQLRRTMTGVKQHVFGLRFDPAGNVLYSCCRDPLIQVWDVRTGAELAVLEGHTDLVMSVDLAADGKTLVSSSADRTVSVWDLEYYRRHLIGNVRLWRDAASGAGAEPRP